MRRVLLSCFATLAACSLIGAHAARPLPFHYDLYTFRGVDGKTDVVSAFAVSAGRLEAEHVDGGMRYRFDVSLVLTDTALDLVRRTEDSVYVEMRSRPDGDHLLSSHVQIAARPSNTTRYRVIMSDATTPGIGQLYAGRLRIPDYSGDELMLSDVALGQPNPTGGWRRGDVTVALLPTSQFPGSTFDVYYEVYNLPAGHEYRTEIAVERVDAGSDRLDEEFAAVRFSGEATPHDDGIMPELRRVATSLTRGRHRLRVTVTDAVTGESVSRTRPFTVRDDERGVTMVQALPRRRIVH